MILLMHILSSIIFALHTQLSLSADLQALAKPKRISLELLKHLLSTVLACRPVATEHLIGIFETVSSVACLYTAAASVWPQAVQAE